MTVPVASLVTIPCDKSQPLWVAAHAVAPTMAVYSERPGDPTRNRRSNARRKSLARSGWPSE